MIVNHWQPTFTKLYGHHWPDDYLTVDTEYTGGSAEKDLICEWGHTMVENRRVIDRKNIVLNWFHEDVRDIVPSDWLKAKLRYCKGNHKCWRITAEVMKEEGISPLKALRFIVKLCDTWRDRGAPFVAHNGFHADERMLRGNIEGFLLKPFRFGENSLIDTGAIHKATLSIESDEPGIRERRDKFFPEATDTLESYFRRVVNAHCPGVMWNLFGCLEHYGLIEKYDIDPERLHTAGYDAWVTHLLFEEFRRWITRDHSGELGFETPAALQRSFDQAEAEHNVAKVEETRVQEKADQDKDKEGSVPSGFKRKRRRRRQRSV